MLPTRRRRVRYAAGIMFGIGKMAVAVYRPPSLLKQAISVAVAALIPAGSLLLARWQEMGTVVAVALSVLATTIWVLSSDDRTSRTQLIRSFRKPRGH